MKFPRIPPRLEGWLSAALVVIVTLLTYGPLIPSLGFYRDDWYLIWTAQARGAQGIMSLFQGDRPFIGWLYALDYNLLGNSPLNWHMYALIIKVFSALAFLWLLRTVWNERKIETTLIALLFVVYPGFYQQPNAATFKNLLLAYGAAMASLACAVLALKGAFVFRKAMLIIASILLAALSIFIYEALIGIEAARLILIWYVLKRDGKLTIRESLRKTVVAAIPYLMFAAAFLFWRLFLFESTRRATNVDVVLSNFGPLSLTSALHLAVEMILDLIETSLLAWGVPFYQFSTSVGDARITAMATGLALIVLALTGAYLFLMRGQASPSDEAGENLQASRDWLWLGAMIIFVTTLPIVLAGRNVIFDIQWDRYTYQSVAGVALFMGGIIFYGLKGRLRWAALCLLLMSGVLTQLFSANYYRRFWRVESDAMWQLAWRAPQIEEGTTVVLVLPGNYALAEEYEVWSPINLVYHPRQELKIAGQVMYDDLWLEAVLGAQEERLVRGTVMVKRDYAKLLLVTQPSAFSCLHVIDGARAELTAQERLDVQRLASFSDANLIDPSGAQAVPPSEIFGDEPSHDWCYFYQQMDLARQRKDWESAAQFADEAIALGYQPYEVSEWLPALEAYIHVGDQKMAKRIALLIRVDKKTYQSICQRLKPLTGTPAEYDRDLLAESLCKHD
ncbi:MAG TPA: hypothetical protein PKE62_16770 [Anaerolineales bacterium]|nr:hypothetical protein [Anaerolineales bacterium]